MAGGTEPVEHAYLVLTGTSIFVVAMDKDEATRRAGYIEGVVVELPIVADFRRNHGGQSSAERRAEREMDGD